MSKAEIIPLDMRDIVREHGWQSWGRTMEAIEHRRRAGEHARGRLYSAMYRAGYRGPTQPGATVGDVAQGVLRAFAETRHDTDRLIQITRADLWARGFGVLREIPSIEWTLHSKAEILALIDSEMQGDPIPTALRFFLTSLYPARFE